ncbi:MAG: hypothetical protein NC301_06790 [Bacteroides sp.]|nr:hypothetical protein [Bacteroides sp.]MCM1378919.1 hypothetical protein [Bacteroides sp.]MCM1445535.1 hypothetical protein [Prevotella sp.]
MKKTTTIIISILCLGVLIISCPNEQKHKEAVAQMASNYFRNKLNNNIDSDEDEAYALVGSTLASGLISLFVNFNYTVDNYFIFSVGKINFMGKEKTVSYGILGHVFTPNNNQISKAADNLN